MTGETERKRGLRVVVASLDIETRVKLYKAHSTVGKLVDGCFEDVMGEEAERIEALRGTGEIPEPYRLCQYMGMLLCAKDEDLTVVLREARIRFLPVLDRLIEERRVGHALLGPLMLVPLISAADGARRFMLVLYIFSDYTREELNEYLGWGCFFEEGEIPEVWPEELPL